MRKNGDVCGVDHAKWLDNRIRLFFHDPKRMFREYVRSGDIVVDIGCGPGAFIPGLCKLVGPQGRVVAIDLQEEMLQLCKEKMHKTGFADRVEFHKCEEDSLGISLQVDFALTFYMVHEVPDPLLLIDQICALLKVGGFYYLAEPKIHVPEEKYREVISRCNENGLVVVRESSSFSRIAVFRKENPV